MNPTENEDTVSAFLDRHDDFALRGFSLPGAEAPDGMLTCYPHRMRGEGHFTALLVRAGDAERRPSADQSLPRPDKAALQCYRGFRAGADAPAPTHVLGSTLISAPLLPDIRGLKVLRAGLQLGECRGRLFLPDHAWAMSVTPPDVPRVPLSEAEAVRWLRGETVDASGSGWVLPCFAGLPLGWGKISDGTMRNHYPKGLRRSL